MTASTLDYGGGRPLPAHAVIEDAQADLESGLLIRLHVTLLGMSVGQVVRIASPSPRLEEQLRWFEAASGNALLAVRPDPRRTGWSNLYLRKGRARTDWAIDRSESMGAATARPEPALAVAELMPRRLWLYTNYDCNLACDYCCVVAGPRADPRRLPTERVVALSTEAADAGFERVFLTGGEPMLRPDLPDLIDAITGRIPVTLLTNAMLLRGPRWERLRPLIEAARPLTFQVSLDSVHPGRHDAHRGRGSHARALAGIRALRDAGAHVRLAASLPADGLDEIPALHTLADELGIAPVDRIFRPIALRGAADDGEPIRPSDVAPEITCDAQGWFWHPISNDPDMRIGVPPDATLAIALRAVHTRLAALLEGDAARLDRFVCG